MEKLIARSISLIGLILLLACSDDDEGKIDDRTNLEDYQSTYDLIQGEIWDVNCISCHTAGTSFARQSDLILTNDISYEQLINRPPNNNAAIEDGLELVGDDGLESLYKSFLWEKINAPDIEHFYSDHPEYGSIMPLGGNFLTYGELELIREWIVSGAPREVIVADISLLDNNTRFEELPFKALSVPENGYQFHIEPFEILPNRDREIFIYDELNNEEPIFINKVEITMAPGSHHFILYNFPETLSESFLPNPGEIRDVYDENGSFITSTLLTMQFHQFVQGTQWPNTTYKFPEGVALKLPVNTGFDMNSHYANRTDETITGEVYANIHTVDESEVEHIAKILWLDNQSINLPARQVTTLKRTFRFTEVRNVFQLWSHAHEHMTEFRVYISGGESDGELVYFTNDWEHPPILHIDPPLVMESGTGFTLEATYDNDEDRNIGFGLLSTDEMMMLFGAYY